MHAAYSLRAVTDMEVAVSIIVPVYNAEAQLRRCIDSVLAQSFADFELLLVDDGSTDSSGLLCDSYSDPRVHTFHRENGGVSAARNYAISQARGEYLQFLDSDDYLTADATKLLYETARERGADMVVCDFYRVVGDRVSVKGDIDGSAVLTRAEYAAHMMDNPADFYYGVLWNKLYRADIVRENNLRMDESLQWCEDFLFNLEFIRCAGRFTALNVPLYYYVKTKGSLVSRNNLDFARVMRTKLALFEVYNELYREILSPLEYERARLKVYRFLVDAADDGTVVPGTRLGSERVPVLPAAVTADGVLAEAYRERTLLERCVEPAAMLHSLTVADALTLLAVGEEGFSGTRKDLAALAGLKPGEVSHALAVLTALGWVRVRRGRVSILPGAREGLDALQKGVREFERLRTRGIGDERLRLYEAVRRQIEENVRDALQ